MNAFRSAGLGQIPFLDANPFPALPSPASKAASGAWQPTEESKKLPALQERLVAGGAVTAVVLGLLLFAGNS